MKDPVRKREVFHATSLTLASATTVFAMVSTGLIAGAMAQEFRAEQEQKAVQPKVERKVAWRERKVVTKYVEEPAAPPTTATVTQPQPAAPQPTKSAPKPAPKPKPKPDPTPTSGS